MASRSKLPWWSGYPVSAGATLLGIFAPSALPDWLQLVSFGVGAALLVVGAIATAWHFGIASWFSRHVWWRFRFRPPQSNGGSNFQLSRDTSTLKAIPRSEAWIPLHQALRYLVQESVWAERQPPPSSEAEFNKQVSAEFVERLARGEVRARGAKGIGFSDDGKATEDIPASYWIEGFVTPYGVVALGDVKHDAAGNPKQGHTYLRVLVHHEDLKAIWPASSTTTPSPLGSFVEPIRTKIEAEKARDSSNDVIRPDMPIEGVLVRVYRALGGAPEPGAAREDFNRRVDLEIADRVTMENLTVWGRLGSRALERVPMEAWRKGRLDHRHKLLGHKHPDSSSTQWYSDLAFVAAEVNRVWPN